MPVKCGPGSSTWSCEESRLCKPGMGGFQGSRCRALARWSAILLVAHLLHPFDDFAIETFLNGDVRHGGGRRRPVPVPQTRRKPNHIAGPNLFDRPAFALRPAETERDDQRLTERMGVPRSTSSRLEGDAGTGGAGRSFGLEQRVDAHRAGKPVGGTWSGGL